MILRRELFDSGKIGGLVATAAEKAADVMILFW
jgi:hypothetical protein